MKWLVILILIALSGFNLLCDDNGDIEEEQESEKSEIGSNAGSECSFNGFNSWAPDRKEGALFPLLFPKDPFNKKTVRLESKIIKLLFLSEYISHIRPVF